MIKQILKQIFVSFITALCIANTIIWPVYAQTAGLLFVSPQQYFDNNGRPLSGGKVYYYQPGTLTLKNVWGDANETITLTNPVTLNAAGRPNGAVAVYGEGNYRQIIKDANGNQIADIVTSSGGSGGGSSATGDGDLVGTIKPWAGLIAPNQYAFAYGQELSRTTYSALFTAITQSVLLTCTSGSPILTNVSDTTQIRIGSALELSCVAPGTTVISKTAVSVTLSANSSLSTGATAVFFPFGNGNGSTTFNIPDLRGYIVAGRDNMGGVAAARLTTAYFNPGGTSDPDALGAPGGTQSHAMTLTELVAHTHTGNFTGATGSGTTGIESATHTHSGNTGTESATHTHAYPYATATGAGGAGASGNFALNTSGVTGTESAAHTHSFTSDTESANHTHTFSFNNGAGSFTTASTGSGTAFSVVQPSLTLNYIIKILPDTTSSISTGVTSLGSMTGDIACGSGLLCTGNTISVSGGGIGSPGGPDTSIQFNTAGIFNGSANLTWVDPKLIIGASGTTGQLAITGNTSGSVTQTVQSVAGTPTITWGTSTGTPAVTASAPLSITAATGNIIITGAAGQILAGATPAFTATPTLGVAGSTAGSLSFENATSGSITIQPVTGALGTVTISLPALSGTATLTTNNLSVFAATTSAQLAGVISDEVGSGALVFATSPTLVTPVLGVATATSINKVAITTPATGSTLTIADGKTFTASNTLVLTGTDGTSFAFPSTSDTVVTLGASQTLTSKTLTSPIINGGTATALTNFGIRSSGSGAFDLTLNNTENLTAGRTLTLTINNASRTFNVSGNLTLASDFITSGANSLTLTTTGSTNVTLPTSGTLATINTSQTFSGTNVFSALTQFTDIKLSSGHIYPTSDGTTALRITKADGTTRIMNFDTTNARVGINKDAGAFDLDVNGAVNVGGILTFGTLSATSLGASTTTITGLTLNNTPSSSNDYFLYYSAADGAIRKCTIGACSSASTAGVSSLNGLTGGLSIVGGPAISVSAGGSSVTVSVAGNGAVPGGRLTLSTGVPVMTSTVAATGTLYYTPYINNSVWVYSSGAWTQLIFTETSIALSTGTASKPHDVWGYNNAGTFALELTAWTNDSTRATALAYQDGILVKSGDATRRYLGTVYLDGSKQAQWTYGAVAANCTAAVFQVWNYYNRVTVSTFFGDSTDSWTYNSTTWRAANNSSTARATFIIGVKEDIVYSQYTGYLLAANGSQIPAIAIGVDVVNAISGATAFANVTGTQATTASYQGLFEGYHFISAIESSLAGTSTFYGDSGNPTNTQSGTIVTFRG